MFLGFLQRASRSNLFLGANCVGGCDLDGGVGFLAFLAPWLVGGRPSVGCWGRWASRWGLGLRPWFPRLVSTSIEITI